MGSAHYNDVRSGWVESVNQGQGQTRAHINLTRTDLFWGWTSLTIWKVVFSRLEGLLHFFVIESIALFLIVSCQNPPLLVGKGLAYHYTIIYSPNILKGP